MRGPIVRPALPAGASRGGDASPWLLLASALALAACDASGTAVAPLDAMASDLAPVTDRGADEGGDASDVPGTDLGDAADVSSLDVGDAVDVPTIDAATLDVGALPDATTAPGDGSPDGSTSEAGPSSDVADGGSSDLGGVDVLPEAAVDVAPACVVGRQACAVGAGTVCVDLGADPLHCGACGLACPSPEHGVALCRASACLVACEAGHHACGATCAGNDEVATCGSRCTPCTPPPNATSTCTDGACTFACNPGYLAQGPGCVPIAAPRPLSPLSTSTVTTRTPTLRWVLPAGVDGARGELCADRACTTVLTTFAVTGNRWTSPVALVPGVVFWRLRSRVGTVDGAGVGPVWQFVVPARSSSRDLSWGTALDVNGDGFADVAVGAYSSSSDTGERVQVHHGSAGGPGTTPAATLTGNRGAFGYSVASAGDVNGDGYGDLVVGAIYEAVRAGRAYVFAGGASGVSSTPLVVLHGHDDSSAQFGYVVSGVGDVNGDGYGDLIATASDAAGFTSALYLYLGSATGPRNPFDARWNGTSGSYFGTSASAAGDVNGDGYADVIVGAYGADDYRGRASLYLGSATGLSGEPAVVLTGSTTFRYFGTSVAGAGDVNGDGRGDVVVGTGGVGQAFVYLGSATGLSTTPAVSLATATVGAEPRLRDLAFAGDVNGDGYDDVLSSWTQYDAPRDVAHIHLGGAAGVSATPAATLAGPMETYRTGFGGAVAGLGDVNGDGRSEVAVGAYLLSDVGRVYVYAGTAAGTDVTPLVVLNGPARAGTGFGWSVARADGPFGRATSRPDRLLGEGASGPRRALWASRATWPAFGLD